MRSNPLGSTEEDWELRHEVYKLLKRKTDANTDARKIVECVEHSNGFEVWRLLGVRYEPQAGMKRLAELGELMSLRDKRCKNTQETALIVLELDRRKKIIAMAGANRPTKTSPSTLSGCRWIHPPRRMLQVRRIWIPSATQS